jgi:vitamin B12 transporter
MPPAAVGAAQSQAAAYAQVGYNMGSVLRLVFGVRGENDTPAGGVVAPSFGTRLHLGAAQLSSNVSESYGVPTLVDLYYPGYANPNLLPEKLSNYDTTLSFPHIGGGLSFGYFGRDGSNLIVSPPPTYIPFNASRASVNGFQITAAAPPIAGLRLSASLTDLYRAIDTTTGVRLPNTPPIIATLGIERPFDAGSLAFGAHLRIVGSSPDVPNFGGGSPFADPYDGYTTADAFIRYRIAKSAILSARVMNLTNQSYAPIFGYPAPGRTLQLELATR